MTGRLYYDDAYRTRFQARVVERLEWEGQPAVVLDRTAFYPTGGGQPHDTGALNGVPVVDVVSRQEDEAVVHVLAAPLADEQVVGQVDWARRFDLMQQHTGQHVLSAACVEQLGANTVGFHLSGEYATIDLDRALLTAEDLAGVEEKANAIVFENRLVTTRWVPDEEVADLPLRKPLAHAGPVRVVEVADFDCSACGGTHVRATGEIGLIKITRSERRGAETRLEFLCGHRALADYAAKNALLLNLAAEFTVGHWEIPDLVHRLAAELKETRRELRRSRDALLDAQAEALWQGAAPVGEVRLVRAELEGRPMADLKHLAQRLIEHPRTVALLGSRQPAGETSYLAFARSADLDLPMGDLVREACR
ncbi:MAG TPA: alanyl-tRNA editing protein, partial [Anaerolineae bacterium]|nr:alanyl-tRNA editing protein [Anaerolineae bacterium]